MEGMRALGVFGGEEPDGLFVCAVCSASPARPCGSGGTAAAVPGKRVVCVVFCSHSGAATGGAQPLNAAVGRDGARNGSEERGLKGEARTHTPGALACWCS